MKPLAGLAGLMLVASLVAASEPIPFDSPRWQIAVSERFGGRGVQAAFEDTDGLSFVK